MIEGGPAADSVCFDSLVKEKEGEKCRDRKNSIFLPQKIRISTRGGE